MLNLKNNKKSSGYTVLELIMTLSIIGIIAAMLLLAIKPMSSRGDKLHSKVNHEIEYIASELFADPQAYAENAQTANLGFRNTSQVYINSKKYSGNTKFCELFQVYITDKTEDASENSGTCYNMSNYDDTSIFDQTPTFTSSDGIRWWLPETSFSKKYDVVYVDVDSKKTSSDCMLDSNDPTFPDNKYCADSKTIADRFKYYVFADGTVKTKTTKGEDDDANKYKINVEVTVNNEDGNPDPSLSITKNILDGTIISEGGEVKIEISDNEKKDIVAGGEYTLSATPKSGYESNWVGNKKRIIIAKKETNLKISFDKIKTYNLTVDVATTESAQFDKITNYELKGNCEYEADSNGTHYAEIAIDEDTDESVVQYKPCENSYCNYRKKRFKLSCTNVPLAKDSTNKKFTATGLRIGDYRLELEIDGASSYEFDNDSKNYSNDFIISSTDKVINVNFK